jgi:uncharacterized protein YjbI with pentapeptide repeats
MSTKTTIDLTTASPAEQAALLRRSVVEWNDAVRASRRQQRYWRAYLGCADLTGARLAGARLAGARLADADLGGHKLTGRHASLGEAAGYPVLMLAADNPEGHLLRAGCWTGTLDDAVERALQEAEEEGMDREALTRREAEAVVQHGRALLWAWAEADAEGEDDA